MAPDRVTPDNMIWFVAEHERRLEHMEERTEDLNVLKSDVARMRDSIHSLKGDMEAIRLQMQVYATKADVADLRKAFEGLRNAMNRAAVTFGGGAIMFALTIWAVFK